MSMKKRSAMALRKMAALLDPSPQRQTRYAYKAKWSPKDDEYVGLVAEFPSLSWLAPTAGEAIVGAERLVDDILADMAETGETPPPPLADRRHSATTVYNIKTVADADASIARAHQRLENARAASKLLGRA